MLTFPSFFVMCVCVLLETGVTECQKLDKGSVTFFQSRACLFLSDLNCSLGFSPSSPLAVSRIASWFGYCITGPNLREIMAFL